MSSTLALSEDERVRLAIQALPSLSVDLLPSMDDSCPICLLSFKTILSGERSRSHSVELEPLDADAIIIGGTPFPEEHLGVTKLLGCGHLFCKRDLVEWISSWHGTCPTCRHPFLEIKPPSESDDESSDGGEWLPTEEDDLDDGDDFDMWEDDDGASELEFDTDMRDADDELAAETHMLETDCVDAEVDWDAASLCGAISGDDTGAMPSEP